MIRSLKSGKETTGYLVRSGSAHVRESSGRGVLIAKIAIHLALGLDGHTLGDEVLFDRVDEVLAFDILRCGTAMMRNPGSGIWSLAKGSANSS